MIDNKQNSKLDEAIESNVHPILRFLQLLISPLSGWKNIKKSNYSPDTVSRKLFYPMMALVSVGMFMSMIYNSALSLSFVLQRAIVIFVAFFFGYFAILLSCGFMLKEKSREKIESNFGKVFVMMSMSVLIFFYIIYEIVPMLEPILIFTPLYVIYLIFRGVRFLRIPEDEKLSTIIILSGLIIGLPILLNWLFLTIMPQVD